LDREALTRFYASATGLLLCLLGLVGFAVGPEFAEPALTEDLPGPYPVNGWVDSLHLVTGLIALALARSKPAVWALVGGLLYTGLGLWGILAPDGSLLAGLLPAPRLVNATNLVIGLTGLAAVIASRSPSVQAPGLGRKRRIRRTRRRRRKVVRPRTGG
jgi:hypothetical protein